MLQENITRLEPYLRSWSIDGWLGGGSFGDVYRIKREDLGRTLYSALKVISIPKDRSELQNITMSCGSEAETRAHLDEMKKDIVQEIVMMEQLKGKTNIVSYEDAYIIEKDEGKELGYDILIRMELLKEIRTVRLENPELYKKDYREIHKVGLDMCEALKVCHAKNIMHRDIKLANIFRTQDGCYKLGDFGIARTLHESSMAMSFKGTYEFMAPEIFNKEKYDYRADIYSLGMVLYYMLNDFHMAFSSGTKKIISSEAQDEALRKRMTGEPLPTLRHVSEALNAILIKACAFNPNDRYSTAEEFEEALRSLNKEDLERIDFTVQKEISDVHTDIVEDVKDDIKDDIDSVDENKNDETGGFWKKKYTIIAIIVVLIIGGIVALVSLLPKSGNEVPVEDNKEVQGVQSSELPVEDDTKEDDTKEDDTKEDENIEIPKVIVTGIPTAQNAEIGQELKNVTLSGEFWSKEENENVVVAGELRWDEEALVLEKSGEFAWTFYPEDMERYEILHGTVWVTVLINDTLTGLEEVLAVEDKAALMDVDLSDCDLTDLDMLIGAVNLKYLSLDDNHLESIEILQSCTNLQFVSLTGNKELKDITPLLSLEELQAVFMDGTAISEEDKERIKEILVE